MTYGNNNPYRYRDPDGRSPEEEETLREAGMSRPPLGEQAQGAADVVHATGDGIWEGFKIWAGGEIVAEMWAWVLSNRVFRGLARSLIERGDWRPFVAGFA